jgi:hypothetical protein
MMSSKASESLRSQAVISKEKRGRQYCTLPNHFAEVSKMVDMRL